jgi:hypothetical protein
MMSSSVSSTAGPLAGSRRPGFRIDEDRHVVVRIDGIGQHRDVVDVDAAMPSALHQGVGAGDDVTGHAGSP